MPLPYGSRIEAGEITGLHRSRPEGEADWMAVKDHQIHRFLFSCAATVQSHFSLSDPDSKMIRMMEDLVEFLITKNVLTFTEQPEPVQRKLGRRKQLREDLGMSGNLIDKDAVFFRSLRRQPI